MSEQATHTTRDEPIGGITTVGPVEHYALFWSYPADSGRIDHDACSEPERHSDKSGELVEAGLLANVDRVKYLLGVVLRAVDGARDGVRPHVVALLRPQQRF